MPGALHGNIGWQTQRAFRYGWQVRAVIRFGASHALQAFPREFLVPLDEGDVFFRRAHLRLQCVYFSRSSRHVLHLDVLRVFRKLDRRIVRVGVPDRLPVLQRLYVRSHLHQLAHVCRVGERGAAPRLFTINHLRQETVGLLRQTVYLGSALTH